MYIYIYIYICKNRLWLASSSRRSISSEICLKVLVLVFVILERSRTFRRYSSEPVVLMF